MLLRLIKKSCIFSRLVPQRYFSDKTNKKACFIPDCQKFEKLVNEANPFVDKSALIYELLKSKNQAILFTRPRRWGKTLNLSMLNNFFQPDVDQNTGKISYHTKSKKYLFENLMIKNACLRYDPVTNEKKKINLLDCQGSFPVINITFKGDVQYDPEDVIKHFTRILEPTFKEHSYLLNVNDRLFGQGRKLFEKLVHGKTLEKHELFISLEILIEALNKHYNRKVVVLLDDYDKYLVNLAHFNSPYYEKALTLTKGFLSPLKLQMQKLLLTVFTGGSNAVRSEICSELDHFQLDSVMKAKYSEFFGFTGPEVGNLIESVVNFKPVLKTQKIGDNIKDRYNGYIINEKIIFNPWSIMTCLNNLYIGDKKPYANSWISSINAGIVENALKKSKSLYEFERFIYKKYAKFAYKDSYKLKSVDEDGEFFLSSLVDAGYLTCKKEKENVFEIPNNDIRDYFYKDLLQVWLYIYGDIKLESIM